MKTGANMDPRHEDTLKQLEWVDENTPKGWKGEPQSLETQINYRGISIWINIQFTGNSFEVITKLKEESQAFELSHIIDNWFPNKIEENQKIIDEESICERTNNILISDMEYIDWILDSKEQAFKVRANELCDLYLQAQKDIKAISQSFQAKKLK